MNSYLLLMHDDAGDPRAADDADRWAAYLASLQDSGDFEGGSAVGPGQALRRGLAPRVADTPITGYLRVRARDARDAERFLVGNPVFEAGGTVEIRLLPRD